MLKSRAANITKYLLLFVLVSLVVFAITIPYSDISDAVLPANYQEDYKGKQNTSALTYDWYVDDLDIDSLKSTIQGWFDSTELYDFSYVEENPIIIAVIDTGVNFNHDIFLGQYDANGNPTASTELGKYDVFLRDEDGEIVCYNAYADDQKDAENMFNVFDDAPDNHGTHVCGIISILIHELNLEKYIKILPIKASYPNTKDKTSSFPVGAIQKAVLFAMQNDAKVVNMSLAGTGGGLNLITSSYANQAIFCAAAGNEHTSANYYPAASTNVIGVMGYTLDVDGDPIFYTNSNYGSQYDIVAPAVNIISADGSGVSKYKTLTGTSMACPIVSFASGLAMLKYTALEEGIGIETSTSDITKLLKGSYTRTLEKDNREYGILDIKKLIDSDNQAYCKLVLDTNNAIQKINKIKTVKMHLTIFPNTESNRGTFAWTVEQNGSVIKTSSISTIEFIPHAVVGDIHVNVVWTFNNKQYEDECTLSIDYADVSPSAVQMDSNSIVDQYDGKYFVNKEIVNTLSGLDNVDPAVIKSIMWYVDGTYTGVNGLTFTYLPKDKGEHVIMAKLNSTILCSNSAQYILESEIPQSSNKQKTIIVGVLIAIASALAIAVLVTIIVLVSKKKKLAKEIKLSNSDEIIEADLIEIVDDSKKKKVLHAEPVQTEDEQKDDFIDAEIVVDKVEEKKEREVDDFVSDATFEDD